MTRARRSQGGTGLLELLVSLPIAVLLLASLAQMVHGALHAQRLAAGQHDSAQQARFALQRMVAAVRSAPSKPLGPKPLASTGDWLSSVTFCLNGASQLIETKPEDTSCTGSRVLADRVRAFAVQTYDAGARATTVVEINVTLGSPTEQGVALTARARMGGIEL